MFCLQGASNLTPSPGICYINQRDFFLTKSFLMENKTQRKDILIIGIGNILLGDEGVGVHVIRELEKIRLPKNVEVIDMGVATFYLPSYIAERKKIILVDAVEGGGKAGDIYRLLPEDIERKERIIFSLHEINISNIIDILRLEKPTVDVVIVGVEPGEIKWGVELSPPLKEKLPAVINFILQEISSFKKEP